MDTLWNLATAPEIAARNPRFAVVPIGSFEQHGPHLPVTTDTLIAGLVAKAVCEAHNGLLLSPVTVSCSHEHAGFPASFSISAVTLALLLKDLVASIEAGGISLTVLVNGHGGNYVAGNVAQELNAVRPRLLVAPTRGQWQAAMDHAGIESGISEDMHAGEVETSILLHALPQAVRTDRVADHAAADRPHLTLRGVRHYSESGVIGFPTRAGAEKGRRLLEKLAGLIGRDVAEVLAAIG